jgi:hypothetical protein
MLNPFYFYSPGSKPDENASKKSDTACFFKTAPKNPAKISKKRRQFFLVFKTPSKRRVKTTRP